MKKKTLKNLEKAQSTYDELWGYSINYPKKWNPSDPRKCIKAYKNLERVKFNFLKAIGKK